MKCALLKRGQTPEDLKKYPIGHGLEILLHKLIELGVPVSQNASRLILALSPQHAVHALRYTALLDDGKTVFTPEPTELFDLMDELLLLGRLSPHGH